MEELTIDEIKEYMSKHLERQSEKLFEDICKYLNHKYPKTFTHFEQGGFRVIAPEDKQVLIINDLKEIGIIKE